MNPIVDAHHHLWDLDACRYPWLMAKGEQRFFGDPTPIQKNYLVSDLRADAGERELVASVHVQVGVAPGDELEETRWLQATAERHGLPSAIVAYCDLESPDAPERLAEQKMYERVRGVRQIIGRSDEEDAATGSGALLENPRWRERLHGLSQLGLTFDLQLTPRQTPRAAEVVADAAPTRVALCHCGSPWDQSTQGLRAWRAGIDLLAQLPNVVCKISGLGMFDHQWTVDSIRPIVEGCIDAFGADRCMFGSNFPVDKLHADYGAVWDAYEKIVEPLTADHQQRLFRETALEFYRIDAAS